MTEYVQTTAMVLEDAIVQQQASNNALEVYLWITKALVLRTHVAGYELTDKVIGWCKSNVTGTQAPKGFQILIGEDELALTKNTFATTTVKNHNLYKYGNLTPFFIDFIQAKVFQFLLAQIGGRFSHII